MKKKYIIRRSAEERQRLTDLVRKGKGAAYRRTHAQILLFTDEGELGPRMPDKSVQCVREVREPWSMRAGRPARYDVEYERNGVAHLIQFYAPFMGWRRIEVADHHAAQQWAEGVCQ